MYDTSLVEETLEPLDPDRRAFRLVGGVLVRHDTRRNTKSLITFDDFHFCNLNPILIHLGRTYCERGAAHSERAQSQRENFYIFVMVVI